MNNWLLNGEAAAAVSADSRGLHYGDGVFETVAVREGHPRLWRLHAERLRRGCRRLGLAVPDLDSLKQRIESVNERYAVAKIVVAAAPAQRGYGRQHDAVDTLLRVYPSQPLPRQLYRDGVTAIECKTRLAAGSALAGLKTLNRLEQVVARNELAGNDCFEGITRDADGFVICGTMSNLFAVRDNQLITPNLERSGVEGVMRRFIVETMESAGRQVRVTRMESLEGLDEVFLCNSQFGVLPLQNCDGQQWNVGPQTQQVRRLLADNGIVEEGA